MYDIREEMMQKMVTELRKDQNRFEIMSDEEYYNSDYGLRRRQRNQKCEKEVYMHCLVPGVEKNLLAVYFHKKNIAIAAPMAFDDFKSDIVVDKEKKDVYKNPYLAFRIIRKDTDNMYDDTKNLILEMLDYATKKHLYHV